MNKLYIILFFVIKLILQYVFKMVYWSSTQKKIYILKITKILFIRSQMPYMMSGTTVYFARYLWQLIRQCDAGLYNIENSKGKQ
jgi:hypothetical protein